MIRKIKAKLLIDIETDFKDDETNSETVKTLILEDLEHAGWNVKDIIYKEFYMKEEE